MPNQKQDEERKVCGLGLCEGLPTEQARGAIWDKAGRPDPTFRDILVPLLYTVTHHGSKQNISLVSLAPVTRRAYKIIAWSWDAHTSGVVRTSSNLFASCNVFSEIHCCS